MPLFGDGRIASTPTLSLRRTTSGTPQRVNPIRRQRVPEARRPDGPIGPSQFGVERFTVPAVLDQRAEEFPDRVLMSIAGTAGDIRADAGSILRGGECLARHRRRPGGYRRAVHGDVPRVGVLLVGCRADRGGDRRGERRQQGRISRACVAAVARQGRHHRRRAASSSARGRRPSGDREDGSGCGGFAVGRTGTRVDAAHRIPHRQNQGTWRRCSSRRARPGRRKRSPRRGTTCSPRPPGWRRPGNSRRATWCGVPCRCSTSAPRRRSWRRCSSARRRCCRRHSGRAKYGTRCAPAAQRVSPEPVPWSRCCGISRRIRGTRSSRCDSSRRHRSRPTCTAASSSGTASGS